MCAWFCRSKKTAVRRARIPWGKGTEALHQWPNASCKKDDTSVQALLADLKTCQNIERGKQLHSKTVECGHDSNMYVVNALINMYAKCGSMVNAHKLFENAKYTDVASWTILIMGYAGNGEGLSGLDLFARMRNGGPEPNSVTFVGALKSCTSLIGVNRWVDCMGWGNAVCNLALENGFHSDIYVQNTLIDMYSKLGSIAEAHLVFDSMEHPDVVSWNALIMGYVDNGQSLTALKLFRKMNCDGPPPTSITFVCALKACSSLATTGEYRDSGKRIHNLAVLNDCNSNVNLLNTLIAMYAKWGNMHDSRLVFDSVERPNVVAWSALIMGYAQNEQGYTALDNFWKMKTEGTAPNSVTFLAALKACASLSGRWDECREQGRKIHKLAVENGCDSNIHVQSTLIDMYAKCHSMVDARKVFDSMKQPCAVSWNALILGYATNGQGFTALELFTRMKCGGPAPDSVTLLAALKACTSLEYVECRCWVKELHHLSLENGCISNMFLQSTLIDMYARCGSMLDARQLFNSMRNPNVASWNALISGYANNGQGLNALDLFTRMKSEGPAPDSITFLAVLKACGLVGELEFGRRIHSDIVKGNHFDEVAVVNCLVDFYAKCGSLVEAEGVFSLHSKTRNVVTWTALLAGFSGCGDYKSVFRLFQGMQDAGFQPDSISFISILACCSHAGLVEKAKEYFDAMSTKYEIIPTIEHYTCMVDILGRANKLDDAMALLKSMPFGLDDVIWTTILCACRKWKNVEIGRLAFQALLTLKRKDAATYVLMGQIYGSRGMLQEQEIVMSMSRKLRP